MGGGFSSCSCELEASGQVGENVKGELDVKMEFHGNEKNEEKKEEE